MVRARAAARDLSLLECALLALLRQAPSSGYDLRKVFALTPLVHFSDSPGAVYPALRRLEQLGHLAPLSTGASGGRRRRPFRLTATGLRALRLWLRQPVTRADLAQARDPSMLRFAFMEEVRGRRACVAFLVQYDGAVRAYLRELQEYRRKHLASFSFSGRLAFESGIESFKTQRRWAQRALQGARR
jgi:DNA-binding PadR family transcriptional regulator